MKLGDPSIHTSAEAEKLISSLNARTATVGIVGMGYVGQPLALSFAESGFKVLGFDVDEKKVAELNAGHSSIEHIDDAAVSRALAECFRCLCPGST